MGVRRVRAARGLAHREGATKVNDVAAGPPLTFRLIGLLLWGLLFPFSIISPL